MKIQICMRIDEDLLKALDSEVTKKINRTAIMLAASKYYLSLNEKEKNNIIKNYIMFENGIDNNE